jgi:hypothetical protein
MLVSFIIYSSTIMGSTALLIIVMLYSPWTMRLSYQTTASTHSKI